MTHYEVHNRSARTDTFIGAFHCHIDAQECANKWQAAWPKHRIVIVRKSANPFR